MLLEKLTNEQGSREGTERKRGGCLTWSVKASCSFLAAAAFHFYLLDTPRLEAELNRSPGGKSWTKERNNKQEGGGGSMVSLLSLPCWVCSLTVVVGVALVGGEVD